MKNDNEQVATQPTPNLSSRFSITVKLTLMYTLSVFGILAIATVFLYWTLVKNIKVENYQFLADKIHILRYILEKRPNNPEVLEGEVELERKAYQFVNFYARVLDKYNNTLLETEGMMDDAALIPSSFPYPFAADESPGKALTLRTSSGKKYLLMAAWAEIGQSNGEMRLIQVALDVSHKDAIIAEYRRTLAIVLFCGVMFSVLAGIIIARKGMRPVEEITLAASRITAARLNERINPEKWPKELTVLAAAFDSMLSRLEDSFGRLSRFSADAAHEIRTPINNLRGETEVALSRARSAEDYRQVLESNLEELEKLSRMIESLLFLARTEKQDIILEKKAFDLYTEIALVIEYYGAMMEEQGITIENACQGKVLICADQILFRRAMSNLLSNAFQATPHGGKITISVEQGDDYAIKVSVSDTGCGIEADDLPRVFDHFYKAGRARSQHRQGAGLGLSIVKSIMDFHGGTVSIQ
ncbi:MAG TPA: heavy metal sensor histidine kinase, partial [Syntrophales bacterium]|nr:heavy metal sensor histidine kinase [Syntrophales bacterium]